MVIDSDAHFAEPADLFTSRGVNVVGDGWNAVIIDGRRFPDGKWDHPINPASYEGGLGRVQRDAYLRGYDADSFCQAFDREGISRGVLLPTRGLAMISAQGVNLALLSHAALVFNVWARDFVAPTNGRLLGAGLLPLHDATAAVAHVEVVKRLGLVAAVTTPSRSRLLDDPTLDPAYAALQGHELPLIIHTGAGAPDTYGEEQPTYLRAHVLVHPFEQQAALLAMVCGGVLEKFPGLRVFFAEAGCGWLPYFAERMDDHAFTFGATDYPLPHRPSFYVQRNCFFSVEAGEDIAHVVKAGFGGCLVYASDLFHGDSRYPRSRHLTKYATGEQWEAVSRLNPIRLYGLS